MRAHLFAATGAGLVLFCAASARGDAGIFRGPYLNNVTTDAITVLFENPTAVAGVLRYGVAQPSEHTIQIGTARKHQEVRITGLSGLAAPGSRFVYELEVEGVVRSGEFHTAPTGRTPFTFLAYGDNRSSETQHQAVVDALMREMSTARFAMSTGDMVSSGLNEGHWDDFFRIEAPFLAKTPTYLAIGNHEVDLGDWTIGRRLFQHPTDVPPASNDESFYRFLYGNVELIVINVETENLYTGLLGLLAGDQARWLEDVLPNPLAGADHRFVFIHQGPYSSKPGRNGNFWLRQWLGSFKQHGIDAVISGHDHYAEWGFTKFGLPYFIHGGGGAPLYENKGLRVEGDHTINYGVSELGYMLVHIDGEKARFEVKDLRGRVVAHYEYGNSAQPACQLAADCGGPPPYGCPGGEWECHRSACRYTCENGSSTLVTCFTDQACEDAIAGQCPGAVRCERPGINPLEYYCACDIPPDCTTTADCQSRPPPVEGCEGTWACQDDVCEFSPVTVCAPPEPADAGTPTDASEAADLGAPSDDAATPPDAEPAPDTGSVSEDAEPAVVDLGPASPDASTAAPPPTGGCDCRAASASPSAGDHRAPLGGLAVLLLGLARRRVRGRRAL